MNYKFNRHLFALILGLSMTNAASASCKPALLAMSKNIDILRNLPIAQITYIYKDAIRDSIDLNRILNAAFEDYKAGNSYDCEAKLKPAFEFLETKYSTLYRKQR